MDNKLITQNIINTLLNMIFLEINTEGFSVKEMTCK